jgi:putative ABC transport system permease protein
MALGATEREVLRLVLASGVKLAGVGVLLGLGVSFFLMRLVRHLLFQVSASDPLTMLLVSITLFSAAFVASYLPAQRASQLDPIVLLRHE